MNNNKNVVAVIILLVGVYFFPWRNMNWGKIEMKTPQTVVVVGQAKTEQKSQLANFSAGVSVVKDKKEDAVKEVNDKMNQLIKSVTDFGIKGVDIKTQNLSYFQQTEMYYEDGRQKSRPGQWNVSNSVEIKLRDVDKASKLAEVLANSGANNVYGPNFSFDDTGEVEKSLFGEAMKDAFAKAEAIAKAGGGTLGKIVSVNESVNSAYPIYGGATMEGRGGGGGEVPVAPGSGTITKSLTVVYELQ